MSKWEVKHRANGSVDMYVARRKTDAGSYECASGYTADCKNIEALVAELNEEAEGQS